MNCQNMRMHDRRRRLTFAGEPFLRQGTLRQMRRQHLDGDTSLEFSIVAFQHDPHAASPDQIERMIVRPAEDALGSLKGLKNMWSRCGEDGGIPLVFGLGVPRGEYPTAQNE